MCLLTIAQPRNRLIRVLPPTTGAALRRDGSYLRCKVCSAVPRRGKLRGYLSSANIFRRGDVGGGGDDRRGGGGSINLVFCFCLHRQSFGSLVNLFSSRSLCLTACWRFYARSSESLNF